MRATKKTQVTPVNGKLRPKPNSSILSFFTKTESPSKQNTALAKDEDEGLFIGDISMKADGQLNVSPEILALLDSDDEDTSRTVSNASRFNEDHGSVKRRKLEGLEASAGRENTASEDARHLEPSNFDCRSSSTPPTKPNEDSSISHSKASLSVKVRGGFFVDDSESENEIDKDHDNPGTKISADAGGEAPFDPTTFEDETSSKVDDKFTSNNKTPPEPPCLNYESTSHAEDEFDGMDDFEIDEFAEEGEEYMERRWMEEQRMLEDELEDEPDGSSTMLSAAKEGPPQDLSKSTDADSAAVCPICGASLSGVSEHEASAHVNGCLDGNPTPLPVTTPEYRTEKSQSERAPSMAKRFQRAAIARPAQESPFNLATRGESASAFSKLMSSHAEDAAWATAAANEMASRGKPAYQRTCPFYKILPGLFICVDAFRYGAVQGCNAYFLSHFHSDHYIGLTSSWCHGHIYCSRVTANLVRQQLKVDPKWVVDLEFEKKAEVSNTQGVHVTMIPANHCPGSSLFLFEKKLSAGKTPKFQRILHCGDFRACPAHVQHPLLRPDTVDLISGKLVQQKIDVCYLDTTYLTPKYSFPSQEDVIESCGQMCVSLSKDRIDCSDAWEETKRERAGKGMVQFIRKSSDLIQTESSDDTESISMSTAPSNQSRGRLLVVIGTYSIGKERVCLGIARALDCKIYAPPQKQRICACLEDPELTARLTTNPLEAQIHMQMLMEIRAETLQEYLNSFKPHFSRIVGFRPTGWNYRPPTSRFTENPAVSTVLHSDGWKSRFRMTDLVPQRGSTKESSCFGVPYSEHSSFRELTMFCCALRIGRVIPTVNVGSKKSRERMKGWVEKWEAEKRKTGLFKVEDGATVW
jgi:DNA cross-link repair 1A protein